ncbi:MAG: nitrate/sulfonate/bicarbonate ABC transporter ATP-binding protein [Chloroflexi bacterium]|nr:nitrate/sulfonate/bicarbonate ABC transporter ATP-binding protein [Chloroflexota bacterium]
MTLPPRTNGGTPSIAPAPEQPVCLVRLEHVSKSWAEGEHAGLVLRDINLSINEGEYLAILGPTASGKSTLLRMITGVVRPTEGRILYRGKPTDGPTPFAAMVFQSPALFPWLTVQENVELPLKAQRVEPETRSKRATDLIDLVGLDGFENAYPRELSVGMRQRVGLARALAVSPELLCLDEPFSALDVLTAENLRRELLTIWLDRSIPLPRAIVMVSHNIEEVALMADRVIVLGREPGRVLADVRVPFPYPRKRTAPEFTHFIDTLYKIVTNPTEATAVVSPSGGRPPIASLPHARIGMINGLIELVAGRGGKEDLHRLGAHLLMEVDDLLPITEAARLLDLAEVKEGDIVLTPLGFRYAEGKRDAKKHMFRQQIIGLPLFSLLLNVLKEKPDHRMEREFFQELLENHFSEDEANYQLSRAIEWGRYAELLGFNDDTDELFLEETEGDGAAAGPDPGER